MPLMRRRGVTLAELLVSLVLFGLVATALLQLYRDQQRFHVGLLHVLDTRRSVQQAIELLAGQLRGIASNDVLARSDSAITYRAPLGVSVICAIDSTRTVIALPSRLDPPTAALGGHLRPRAGDSALIFDPASPTTADDDTWIPVALRDVSSIAPCPLAPAGLARTASQVGSGWALSLSEILPASIDPGAPVWLFHVATLSRYRASSGEWMLGYASCSGGSCSVRQPVSGPYLPASARGLEFRFHDADGLESTGANAVARIDVIARSETPAVLDAAHIRRARWRDSLAGSIALRNRP
jgi:prepilin-type N-terminal cleavage/methylation domain-containing protein